MNFENLISFQNLLFVTGLSQFCQLPAMILAPRMLGWKDDLAKLQTINRQIVKVIGLAIVIVGLGTGVVVMVGAAELAQGGALAAALLAFLSVFWLYRAVVQVAVYRKIWPGGFMGRLSHHGLTLLFFFQAGVYLVGFILALT